MDLVMAMTIDCIDEKSLQDGEMRRQANDKKFVLLLRGQQFGVTETCRCGHR